MSRTPSPDPCEPRRGRELAGCRRWRLVEGRVEVVDGRRSAFEPITREALDRLEIDRSLAALVAGDLTGLVDRRSVPASMSEPIYREDDRAEMSAVREASPAEVELSQIAEGLDAYQGWLETLEQRLASVLGDDRPREDATIDKLATPGRSPMTQTLDVYGERLEATNRRLQHLIGRLEI